MKNKTLKNCKNKRLHLEKQYSQYAVHHGIPLEVKNNRVMSVSPSSYFHLTGVNARGEDSKMYSECSIILHKGTRRKVELDFTRLLLSDSKADLDTLIKWYTDIYVKSYRSIPKKHQLYFFNIKNTIFNMRFDILNTVLLETDRPQINKNTFNRIKNLCKKWTFISANGEHFKITGALKRLDRKNKKKLLN